MARDQALPCTLDGEDAGFDLRLKEVAAADLPTAPGVRAGSGRTGYRHVVEVGWRLALHDNQAGWGEAPRRQGWV
jgi:hypothetical protein